MTPVHARDTAPVTGRDLDTSFGIELRPRTVAELATEHGGTLEADPSRVVRRIVSPENARHEDDLVVVTSIRGAIESAEARGVLLCQRDIAGRSRVEGRWVHDHAMWVVARLLHEVARDAASPNEVPNIDPAAWIDPRAVVHSTAIVRRGAVVLATAQIGEHSEIGEGAVVYGGTRIGARVRVGPLAVIGRPGFGFAAGPERALLRIPQLGGLVVEDDVDIGPLCTVDAGTCLPPFFAAA